MKEFQKLKGLRQQDIIVSLRQLYITGLVHPHIRRKLYHSIDRQIHAGRFKLPDALNLQNNTFVGVLPCSREGGLILQCIYHIGAVHHMVAALFPCFTAAHRSPKYRQQQYTSYPKPPFHRHHPPIIIPDRFSWVPFRISVRLT